MSKGPRPPQDQPPLPPTPMPEPAPSTDPCSDARHVKVHSLATPAVGAFVGIMVDGADVVLIAGGQRLGTAGEPERTELLRCIEAGWRLHGEVAVVEGGRIIAQVFGVR